MLDTTIQVRTDNFDGPLALLLLLIQKEEMDIKELELTKITGQYLDYLANMKSLDFDVAGDYLFLAATLLLLKSKSAISDPELDLLGNDLTDSSLLEITSQAELIKRLEELKHFQKLGEKLWELPKMGYEIFSKPKINRKALVNSILTPMDLEKLTLSMIDLMRKEKRKYSVIRRDRLSIKEKLIFLKEFLQEGVRVTFQEVVSGHEGHEDKGTINVVITFISLLELARLNKISIFQNEANSEIYIEVNKSLDNFDVDLADGFEEEEEENDEVKIDITDDGEIIIGEEVSLPTLEDNGIGETESPLLQ